MDFGTLENVRQEYARKLRLFYAISANLYFCQCRHHFQRALARI